MFAITGITGDIGGQVARILLGAQKPIRAVVRDARKAEEWIERHFRPKPGEKERE
jgi:uncharacterized protein YbjT (DUF2867 family)